MHFHPFFTGNLQVGNLQAAIFAGHFYKVFPIRFYCPRDFIVFAFNLNSKKMLLAVSHKSVHNSPLMNRKRKCLLLTVGYSIVNWMVNKVLIHCYLLAIDISCKSILNGGHPIHCWPLDIRYQPDQQTKCLLLAFGYFVWNYVYLYGVIILNVHRISTGKGRPISYVVIHAY